MQQGWPRLCRLYRERLGLKQEAVAQDFHVTQSTVSRWESGRRIPGSHARRRILDELRKAGSFPSDPLLRLALDQGQSLIALWDRKGHLRALSTRFQRELAHMSAVQDPIGKHADTVFANKGLMALALDTLEPAGFFDGTIPAASMMHPPMVNPRRVVLGGTVTVSILPTEIGPGEIGMFCAYEHDALNVASRRPQMFTATRDVLAAA